MQRICTQLFPTCVPCKRMHSSAEDVKSALRCQTLGPSLVREKRNLGRICECSQSSSWSCSRRVKLDKWTGWRSSEEGSKMSGKTSSRRTSCPDVTLQRGLQREEKLASHWTTSRPQYKVSRSGSLAWCCQSLVIQNVKSHTVWTAAPGRRQKESECFTRLGIFWLNTVLHSDQ